MPTCPGCEQCISYDRLAVHERHCVGIVSVSGGESRAIERLEYRLQALEKLVDAQLPDRENGSESSSFGLDEAEGPL